MRQKLSLILALAAWLLATGSHWDLVQTYAWGRMVADYARVMPLTDAVVKTFSPQTMCPLCHAVADARQQESKNAPMPGWKAIGKIVLVCAPAATGMICRAREVIGEVHWASPNMSVDRAAPPVPPPRLAV